jgi:very-short-patch-repair endonuclease
MAEKRFWSLVRGRRCAGLRFLRQAQAGQYVLDFFCPEARLAVEIDGSIHTVHDVQRNDQNRQKAIEEEMGIYFLRLSNAEVMAITNEELSEKLKEAALRAKSTTPSYGARPARIR